MVEDPTQRGLVALGSQLLEQGDREPVSCSLALMVKPAILPSYWRGTDLSPSNNIAPELQFGV